MRININVNINWHSFFRSRDTASEFGHLTAINKDGWLVSGSPSSSECVQQCVVDNVIDGDFLADWQRGFSYEATDVENPWLQLDLQSSTLEIVMVN